MLTAILLILKRFLSKKEIPAIRSYTYNPALQTTMKDYAGTPLDQNGKFINEEFPTVISYSAVLKFMLERNPQREQKKKDDWRITICKNDDWLFDTVDKIVWLGHASFFIQLSGNACKS